MHVYTGTPAFPVFIYTGNPLSVICLYAVNLAFSLFIYTGNHSLQVFICSKTSLLPIYNYFLCLFPLSPVYFWFLLIYTRSLSRLLVFICTKTCLLFKCICTKSHTCSFTLELINLLHSFMLVFVYFLCFFALELVDFMKDGTVEDCALAGLGFEPPFPPVPVVRLPVLLRREELRSLEPLRFLSMMSLSCRLKIPWFLLHLKYRTPLTEPSFLPVGRKIQTNYKLQF